MAAGPGHAIARARRLLAAAAGAVALLAGAAAAHAAVVGLADQQAGSYADARVQALGLRYARLTVPWDAATSEPQAVATWLAAVSAAGMAPHVAFEHLASDRCPGQPCTRPTVAQYAAAIRRFVARFPQVRTYTTWNEANHASQPVADDPEAVAAYYDELRAACLRSTVVAGDVLDSGSYRNWLERFRRASTTTPRLWGLHDYGDVTYERTTGVDTVLAMVPGRLWIEETGGLVAIRNAAGRQTLTVDEADAARAIDRAFAIAAANPRIARMYVYQWRANPGDRFDAGLVRPDATARPSYAALARDLAAQAAVRWTVRWSTRRAGRLLLRAACTTTARACRGRVSVSIGGRRIAVRAYRTSARHLTAGVHVDVPRALQAPRRARRARGPPELPRTDADPHHTPTNRRYYMTKARRPMAAIAIASVLALSSAGAAWACDGSGTSPSGSTAGTYPGETTSTSTSSDSAGTSATTATATTRHARRLRAHQRHVSS